METLYVVSDLHLGGDSDYRICPPATQLLFADFVETLAAESSSGRDVHLIVNGDAVDFLAEREFKAFTAADAEAESKLRSIIKSTRTVWDGFAQFVRCGGELTIIGGNHDIELALPGARRLLQDHLGDGRVNLLLGGESLHIGNVLIKHGNQYDRWNRVDHESLERLRQSILEGTEAGSFEPPAGSRLVHEIMNPIKEKYSFINLLKPENEAAIPFLGILSPSALGYIDEFIPLLVDAQTTQADTSAVAGARTDAHHPSDRAELDFANEIAYEGQDTQEAGALCDWFAAWDETRDEHKRRKQILRLRRVLDRWLHKHLLIFDTLEEAPEYLEPATRAAREHGFGVIAYGHTHLAKRIDIADSGAIYLNTGTWADLMCVPDTILLPELETEGERQLADFADDLKNNRLERWTSCMPTFARIEMDSGRARDARVLIWKGGKQWTELPRGRLSRLMVKRTAAAGEG